MSASIKKEVASLSLELAANAENTRKGLVQQWQISHRQVLDQILSKLSEERTQRSRYDFGRRVLQSLYFVQMDDRYKRVREAHCSTLHWMFDEPPQNSDWSSFVKWLTSDSMDSGLYWVSGKPGSGKSTLMRFLCDDARTRTLLDTWSGNKSLLFAKCFFWNAGTDIQKSLRGLLRSLLYQLLSQRPTIVHNIFPLRWRAYDLGTGDLGAWTETELLTGLRTMAQAVHGCANISMFIDGLDEFYGNDDERYEIIELLKEMSSSDNLKICVSSRPWVIFQDAFERCPQLSLENLTRADISNYIQETLISNSSYQKFEKYYFKQCSELKTEIVDKARGVFLWVFLVVRAIILGIRDGDTLAEISQAVHGFPSDLEGFFSHLLDTLEDKHRAEATKLFNVVLEEANIRAQRVTLLTMSFAHEKDPNFALVLPISPEDEYQIELRLDMAKRRLNSRCKGMLEVHESSEGQSLFRSLEVDFLHRTVRDFLRTKDMQDMLERYDSNLHTSSLLLCNSYLAQLKIMDLTRNLPLRKAGDLDFFMSSFLANARCIEQVTGQSPTALVDELSRVLDHHASNPASDLKSSANSNDLQDWRDYRTPILSVAIQHRLHLYAIEMIHLEPSLVHAPGERPVLDLALDSGDECPDLKLVRTILDAGGDPLAVVYDDSIWARFISRLARPFRDRNPGWFEVTEMIARKGVPAEIELSTLHHHIFTESRLRSMVNYARAGNRCYVVKVRERLELAFGEQAAAALEPFLLPASEQIRTPVQTIPTQSSITRKHTLKRRDRFHVNHLPITGQSGRARSETRNWKAEAGPASSRHEPISRSRFFFDEEE
jgi:hypothetical protein